MLFTWKAVVATDTGDLTLSGNANANWGEALRITAPLPQGHIKSVTARMPLAAVEGSRVFMNGYQTWTTCPEYSLTDRIWDLRRVPKATVAEHGFDRYGDYHFVKYPCRPGVTHGFSWCYVRRGTEFKLIGSLDEKPGYTMFTYDAEIAFLTVERDCAGLACGGDYPIFDLYFAKGSEDQVFDGWFEAMGVKPLPAKPLRGYTSWYNRFTGITEETIRQDLEGCKKLLAPGNLFQIDDGWQPFVGDWLECDPVKFPSGMRALVEEIHGAGFKAGLWLSPFIAHKDSALVREHPDWVVEVNGEPWFMGDNWGGFVALDIDKPELLDYLRQVLRRVIHEWGFDLLKLDFLYGAAVFGTETETRAARMIRAMDFLRTECGDTPILGCGVPVMPAFGKVEYCRISCDACLEWDGAPFADLTHREHVSSKNAILNTLFRRELCGRAHINDPDVFFLREENISLRDDQKLLLARVNALLGGVFLISDDPGSYTYAQRAAYKELVHLFNDAENVRFDADRFVLTFTLDGEEQILPVPKDMLDL